MAIKQSHPKILIIDDSPDNLSLFADILRPFNYNLSVATNGQKGLQIVKEFHPELILLDIAMPQMDGYEVLKSLKNDKQTSEIPVIFLTAYNSTEEIVKGFEAGAIDYITKPCHPKEFIARVETHLQKARLLTNLKNMMEYSFHELYTPLSVIQSAIELQELEYGQTDYTQMTIAACKTLQNIYDDLYYSINFSSENQHKTLLSFRDIVYRRIKYFMIIAQSRKISFTLDMTDDLLIEVNLSDIERVLDNLISNALKYTQTGHKIKISSYRVNNNLYFSICNPSDKKIDVMKIFDKYYRHDAEIFGMGLGLNLVNSICQKNNIEIQASLTEGIFCINILLNGAT